jgi:integral membrane protein (TIGR01906 family)
VLAAALVVAIAVSVTPILVVNAFRVLATGTFVRTELGRDGFPPDRYGLTTDQRKELALLGLRSIQPGSEGIVLLERARLQNGSPAFGLRELAHMRDVRRLFGIALRGQLIALVVIGALALGLARTRLRTVVPLGLLAGALATLAIAVLTVPLILLGFDGFFVRFHEVFFSGDSWRFNNADTLIRIYPEQFWQDVSRLAAGIAVAQALVLVPLTWWWHRAARRGLG